MYSSRNYKLNFEQINYFRSEGYLILPSFLEKNHKNRLRKEVDNLMKDRNNNNEKLIVSYNEMGFLTSYPPMMEILEQILGPNFILHHIHSNRHDYGMEGIHWHQDYEQYPQTNRSHLMLHVFYYLNGLNGEIGDLLILPRSHNVLSQRSLEIFGTKDLPGSISINSLPYGSAIIVHSAIWHARRQKNGGNNNPRYFIDISYCQFGVKWPAYKELSTTEIINKKALYMGLDRGGKYLHLYDSSQFYDYKSIIDNFNDVNKGSLIKYIIKQT